LARTNLINQLLDAKSRSLFIISLVFLVLPSGYDVFINPLLLVLLLNTIISVKGSDWLAAIKTPVFYLPAMFYAYYAASMLWAENPSNAGLQLETKLTLFAAPLVLAANHRFLKYANRNRLLSLFVLGNVLTMVYLFAIAIARALEEGSTYLVVEETGKHISFFTYTMLAEPLMHVGYLSTYVGVAILICVYMLIFDGGRRWVIVPTLLFLFVSLFLLQGRINILALFAILGLALVAFAIKSRAYKWLGLPVLGMVLVAIFLIFGPKTLTQRFMQVPDFSYDISAPAEEFNSATYRLAEWSGALYVIKQNPLFGTGVGDNRTALQKAYKEIGFNVGVERNYNAHNQYLETTIASGIVGLLLLLILLIGYGWLAFKNRDLLIVYSILFFVLCMLTESMLERAWAVVFFAVFFPVMLLAAPGPQKTVSRRN
jgi:O-antigen ligase